MSYILDALRKADAERARGALPTLQTVAPGPPGPAAGGGGGAARHGRWWAGALAVLALLGVAAWVLLPSRDPTVLAPAPVVALPAERALLAVPAPAPLASAATPVVGQEALPASGAAPLQARINLPAPPQPASAVAAAPSAAATRASAAPLPRLDDLPAALKRQVPALKVGGSVYSDQPASRFVMVNGQLLREGDAVSPGLVLERIGARSMVLRLREQRFEVPY
jgi:general secretion pathway protein B